MKVSHYTATGNTFVVCDTVGDPLTDDQKSAFVTENAKERDGVLFVERRERFFMDYFNKDGQRASFCGNGARSFTKYLFESGYAEGKNVTFDSFSGPVEGQIVGEEIRIKMPPVKTEQRHGSSEGRYATVGVPHYVIFVEDVESVDVANLGASLRKELDANVDFVQILGKDAVKLRTYERGVEAETKACGTGATASAYFSNSLNGWNAREIEVTVPGGKLKVSFDGKDLYLQGGAENV